MPDIAKVDLEFLVQIVAMAWSGYKKTQYSEFGR
jgi:hypothetical protein